MNSFPCTSCGACCRRISQAVTNLENAGISFEFPYSWDDTGKCEMLTSDNQCLVYHDRPIICNIEKFAEYFKLNKRDFYKQNASACNELIKEDNLPDKFLVKL